MVVGTLRQRTVRGEATSHCFLLASLAVVVRVERTRTLMAEIFVRMWYFCTGYTALILAGVSQRNRQKLMYDVMCSFELFP